MNDELFLEMVNSQLSKMTDQEKADWIYKKSSKANRRSARRLFKFIKSQPSLEQKISEVRFSTSELKKRQLRIEKQEIYFECLH